MSAPEVLSTPPPIFATTTHARLREVLQDLILHRQSLTPEQASLIGVDFSHDIQLRR
jgi:hypothetical protein